MEPWLCACDHWPVDDILQCLLVAARFGAGPRQALVESKNLIEYVGYLIFCPIHTVQEASLRVLLTLATNHDTVMQRLVEKRIVSPRLFARMPRSNTAVMGLISRLEKIAIRACPSPWKHRDREIERAILGEKFEPLRMMCREHLRDSGRSSFQAGDYEAASRFYSAATMIASDLSPAMDQLDAVLLSNLAECQLRLERHSDAIHSASLALYYSFDPEENQVALKAAFRRAKALLACQRYFEALSDAAYCTRHNAHESKFTELREKAAQLLEASRRDEGRKASAHIRHRRCAGCGLEGPGMKKCSRCETAFFCSRTCLREAWPEHQKVCSKEGSKNGTKSNGKEGKKDA